MTNKSIVNTSLGVAGLLTALAITAGSTPTTAVAQDSMPDELVLTGVVRDFRERTATGGHMDFERQPTRGFGHYVGQVADELDADGKPVFSSTGAKVLSQWRDAQGRNVMRPRDYIETRSGDVAGRVETQAGGSLSTAENFSKWFRDDASSNMSKPLAITLRRVSGTNMYSFNDRNDPAYQALGGFFPINNDMFGNSGGSTPTKNFHFTFELDTRFTYKRGTGQVFTFIGDDDVYVFIDGKCVIDLGGVHSAISQTIELDRLGWLEDNEDYSLKFFFAERHRTQSNFRIDTTLNLRPAELPKTSGLAD